MSSALGDAKELYSILVECKELLSGETGVAKTQTKVISKEREVERAALTSQQATRLLYRFNHLLSHMGFPEDVNAAIAKMQQVVFMLRMMEMSIHMIQLATPYGWAMGIMGIASVAVSLPDLGQ